MVSDVLFLGSFGQFQDLLVSSWAPSHTVRSHRAGGEVPLHQDVPYQYMLVFICVNWVQPP